MSTPPVPTPSPFICAASNPSVVYYLQDGVARQVPDAATLGYMLPGQTVRTVSDAELAATKMGSVLPSRADNTILHALVPVPVFAGLPLDAFIMQGGNKRSIPDQSTFFALEAIYGQAHIASPADLAAIPSGLAMPSRADGTVYKGSAAIYAFLIKAAAKCRKCDDEYRATTDPAAATLDCFPTGIAARR